MNFILKIVEGPNRGAEIALVEGVAVTLGKSEDCDIALADSTLPDVPMKIEASSGGVVVDGSTIEPYHVKTVGSTSFAVGPADSPWGDLVWPGKDEPTAPDGQVVPPEPVAAPPPSPDAEPHDKRRVGCLGCVAAVVLLLLVLAILAWMFRGDVRSYVEKAWNRAEGGQKSEKADSNGPSAADKVADIAVRYGLTVSETNGHTVLVGNLKTRRDRLSATAEAYQAMPGIDLDISDDESFRTAADDALFTLTEGAISVVSATNRVLALSGRASSPTDLKRLIEALNKDVPRLRNVELSLVRLAPPAAPEREDEEVGGGVLLSSDLPKRRSARKSGPASPSFPVCGILTSPYPCLVMRNGARVMEGASIGDSVILKIEADAVTVTNSTGVLVWKP